MGFRKEKLGKKKGGVGDGAMFISGPREEWSGGGERGGKIQQGDERKDIKKNGEWKSLCRDQRKDRR